MRNATAASPARNDTMKPTTSTVGSEKSACALRASSSAFAPALINSLKVLTYEDFITTVANGRAKLSASQTVVMPSFATDPNVMNYLDAIYAYLKARSDGKLGEGRPFRVGEKRFTD